jgi:hypothetical protein
MEDAFFSAKKASADHLRKTDELPSLAHYEAAAVRRPLSFPKLAQSRIRD